MEVRSCVDLNAYSFYQRSASYVYFIGAYKVLAELRF